MAEKNLAKEWSLSIGNWSIGVFRNNLGGYGVVYRYPLRNWEMNCFVPLLGAHP